MTLAPARAALAAIAAPMPVAPPVTMTVLPANPAEPITLLPSCVFLSARGPPRSARQPLHGRSSAKRHRLSRVVPPINSRLSRSRPYPPTNALVFRPPIPIVGPRVRGSGTFRRTRRGGCGAPTSPAARGARSRRTTPRTAMPGTTCLSTRPTPAHTGGVRTASPAYATRTGSCTCRLPCGTSGTTASRNAGSG